MAKDSRNASAGGVVCDPVGNWVLGYNQYLDNLEVVRALTVEWSKDLGITLIRRIQRVMNYEGQWEIIYVPKNCNLSADRLAKLSLAWQSNLQNFDVLSDDVLEALKQD
ncbi:hypothetical protein Goari_012214 [Gossypium aridum]|uniref:RNase H type-1 domain-containing protein n=1 Tax=Gossypium aridum TaxID=34290 RepID=A0A7J8WZX2_GOSAI|nr:hypothetical protein [Gossypium aridum]